MQHCQCGIRSESMEVRNHSSQVFYYIFCLTVSMHVILGHNVSLVTISIENVDSFKGPKFNLNYRHCQSYYETEDIFNGNNFVFQSFCTGTGPIVHWACTVSHIYIFIHRYHVMCRKSISIRKANGTNV